MNKILISALLSLPLAVLAGPASAATLVFQTNFDSVAVPAGSFVILQEVEGWSATAGDGIEVQNNAAGAPFSPTNLVELDSNNNSAMSRTIAAAGKYELKFLYSARPNVPATSNGIDVLLNDVGIFNVTGNGGSGTNWLPQSVRFTVGAGTKLTFAATGTSESLGGYLDNVSLTAVPEPATWAMMVGGFGFVGAAMRRRTRTSITYA